ncbi:hypothetical protein [Devosia sp.]|uniref:hypothetical protein n=1 Tax=Devosia sp. TaxID=1871048 RepID=UPI00292E20A2|nr:hypothetical protein [Devosia sp.]
MNAPTIRLTIALCSLGAALPAAAADIRGQLTPDLIYQHCKTAGVGSETEGTFMLPGGRVTGTVLCTQADLVAPSLPASRHGDDEDDDHEDDDHEDDDND